MSRGYRVTWVDVAGQVNARDELEVSLSLLGILSEAEMAALLRDELARAGWRKDRDGAMTRTEGDMRLRLTPDARAVVAQVEREGEVHGRGVSQNQAEAALEVAREQTRERLQRDASGTLLAREPAVRAALGEALQRVYLEALKRKAQSLGDVESVQETRGADGEYEVTIKVKA